MNEMFDHNHDGKLSANERMEEDYFITEMMDQSESSPHIHKTSGSGNAKSKLLGFLFLIMGFSSFIYFPIFALVMIGLAIYFFLN